MVIDKSILTSRVNRVVKRLGKEIEVNATYIFGSQVDGSADEYSDLDIAIFVENFIKWTLMRQVKVSCRMKEAEGDDLDLLFFDADELPNPSPASFAGWVVRNGVRVV
ncbi:MAG: nucleotidyltransferase domain-containing protein [Calditrichaeota bacterium]|nr:nucleotidyltransferase domain-containing protein [Calditrichota bacterium]